MDGLAGEEKQRNAHITPRPFFERAFFESENRVRKDECILYATESGRLLGGSLIT